MIRAVSLTLAAVLCLAASAPESRLEQFFRLRKEAGAAAQANDIARAETLLEQALALYPTSPGALIRLARVEIAADKPAEAVAHLDAYARLGLTWDIAGDKALSTLAARPDFTPVAARLAANAASVGTLTVAADMPRTGPIFEGLVWRDDHWLVSSVSEKTIYRIDRNGAATVFLKGDAETGGVFGMALDGKVLWAAEAAGPDIPGSGGAARTALLRIDAATGALLARYPVEGAPGPVQLGDVVVAPDGTVYASASVGAAIYRLKPGAQALEVALASNEMGSPQGMVVCPGDALLIADYSTGLHRLDLKTGRLEPVGGMRVAMAGTDGLFFAGHRYAMRGARPHPMAVVATQNGVSPARVIRLRISADCRQIESMAVVAANHPALDDLTLGAAMPAGVAVIGRGGWAGYGGDGKALADARPETGQILTFPYPDD
ncbi:tetratricopeptide repeat protein [Caulobacter sp. NIBR1757]|uniref:tetratricopeptide repeat protein n=1 Tax=Caulobacter sp. NIBR1757 TaxID=3016000 RepID=UPI0022F12905|nr:tetratricopeptide repeat protein [Caulobacter sp. NIBR1757]WGM40295.1 hypothetical protein AMEJIAPC_03239 [Caulobacter sp. NIBR1757]